MSNQACKCFNGLGYVGIDGRVSLMWEHCAKCKNHNDCTRYGCASVAAEVLDNVSMPPLSSKEKQEAFRARNAMLGLTEVRGIYLPPAMHAALKKIAAQMLKKTA